MGKSVGAILQNGLNDKIMPSCSTIGNGKHLSYEVGYTIQYFRKIHPMAIWRIN